MKDHAPLEGIVHVTVRGSGLSHRCEPADFGYLCGCCRTPLPKMPPEVGDKCYGCNATVEEVKWKRSETRP